MMPFDGGGQPFHSWYVSLVQMRVGDVGGNTLGLYGGVFGPSCRHILAHGYQGAFHLWEKVGGEESDVQQWRPLAAPGGHFAPVQARVLRFLHLAPSPPTLPAPLSLSLSRD